ncbi:hypothetical protein RND64_02550 [Gordonia sp. w5E2]|uniref:Uncharacterized protein n=1 Tax=Gordonia jacobaea TaxID=122202 RepID=A0ABR5I853_9ACTN|nr:MULTISPECIES: hypothetical protein [Gordonia]KNA89827.1 hypothetical protein ABW18_19320 [Gordonia jacobaea]
MGIANRLWDDSVYLPVDVNLPQPAMAGQLLTILHLLDAPREEQVEGVRTWLQTNEPSKSLQISLERRGLGATLNQL